MKNQTEEIDVFKGRSHAIRNAIAHNNALTFNYLRKLKSQVLINFVHPDTRESIGKEMDLIIKTNPLTGDTHYVPAKSLDIIEN